MFALMGFLGFVNVYAMRVNLSVAIVVMVNNTSNDSHKNGSSFNNNTCPVPLAPNSTQPDTNQVSKGQHIWTPRHSA
jgi:ACS family sodium-dependent inorganic phosphate cotransporter-like MFS transporter 5